jgi:hypothetical protein
VGQATLKIRLLSNGGYDSNSIIAQARKEDGKGNPIKKGHSAQRLTTRTL